jgi:hypothetical protein
MRLLACSALALSLLAPCCGGNVTVDTVDTGGTTAGTGGTTTGTTTGTFTTATGTFTTTTSTTTSVCVAYCQAVTAVCPANPPPHGCAAYCEKMAPLFEAACPAVWQAFLVCYTSHPSEACNMMEACTAAWKAWEECAMTVCAGYPSPCE